MNNEHLSCARICKGIDSQPVGSVQQTLFVKPARQAQNRFLGFLYVFKYGPCVAYFFIWVGGGTWPWDAEDKLLFHGNLLLLMLIYIPNTPILEYS